MLCQANILFLMLVSYVFEETGCILIENIALAPWFQPGSRWGGGGYLKVDSSVGSLINFYNLQFYNRECSIWSANPPSNRDLVFVSLEGATEYTTCAGLLTASSSAWPNTDPVSRRTSFLLASQLRQRMLATVIPTLAHSLLV